MVSRPLQWAMAVRLPDEQPVNQFCDAFKTFGVQSTDKLHLNSDWQTICSKDTASLALIDTLTSHPAAACQIIPQSVLPRISCSRFLCFVSDLPPIPRNRSCAVTLPFDARFQRPAYPSSSPGHVKPERRQSFERVGTLEGHFL